MSHALGIESNDQDPSAIAHKVDESTVVTHVLTRRRTDIQDVGESTLTVGEQTVGETTVIP